VPGEYAILLALAVVGGAGVPGPGDSALIAAGLLAADGHLSLGLVLLFAFLGCWVGRIVGHQLGARGGRSLMQRRGLLEGFRSRTVAKGDQLFIRFPRLAVLVAPAPIAGIHHVRLRVFALAAVLVALNWTLLTGLTSYFLGEGAKDLLGTVGAKSAVVIVVFAGIGLTYRYLWQRRRRSASELTEQ